MGAVVGWGAWHGGDGKKETPWHRNGVILESATP